MVHEAGPGGGYDAPRPDDSDNIIDDDALGPGASKGWRHEDTPSPLCGHVILVMDILLSAVQDHAAALQDEL